MDDAPLNPAPTIAVPSRADADRSVEAARRLWCRTLAHWASDVLDLRRSDLLRPTWSSSSAWERAA